MGGKGSSLSPPSHPPSSPELQLQKAPLQAPPQAECVVFGAPLWPAAPTPLPPPSQVLSRARAPPGAPCLPPPPQELTASSGLPSVPSPRISAHFLNPQIPALPSPQGGTDPVRRTWGDGASALCLLPAGQWGALQPAAWSQALRLSAGGLGAVSWGTWPCRAGPSFAGLLGGFLYLHHPTL